MFLPQTPVDAFIHRLDGVRGRPPKVRATCPHCSRKGALSVSEGHSGALVRCFAGCALPDITGAVALKVADLFPPRNPERLRERDAMRRSYRATPRLAIAGALKVELAKTRERLRAEFGYERPLRSSDHNAARQRVAKIYGIPPLAMVEAFCWEIPPHDSDPAWPCLYRRALDEETRRRWHAIYPEAEAWETDPSGPSRYDRMRAETLARQWLRALAA